jgi:chloramphenicol-sensitive protein RarD
VALGYPIYFVLRKHFKLNHIGGLWFDLVLMLPISALFAINGAMSISFLENFPKFFYLLPILGLLSAGALITYILSTKYLSMSLFGLLGYVEPVLLLAVAMLIGETITQSEIFTYGPIWLSVCILIFEGSLFLFKTKKNLSD